MYACIDWPRADACQQHIIVTIFAMCDSSLVGVVGPAHVCVQSHFNVFDCAESGVDFYIPALNAYSMTHRIEPKWIGGNVPKNITN